MTWQTPWRITVLAVATLAGAWAGTPLAAEERPAGAAPAATASTPAQQVLLAALEGLEASNVEQRSGVMPLGQDWILRHADWSRRVYDARVRVDGSRPARIRAAEERLHTARALSKMLDQRKGQDVTRAGLSEGKYWLAVAEHELAKAKAE